MDQKFYQCGFCLYVSLKRESGRNQMKAHMKTKGHSERALFTEKVEMTRAECDYLFHNCAFHLNSGNTFEKRLEILNQFKNK